MAQINKQIKTPEKELNKMEISNLPDAKFKPLVIRMLKEISEDPSTQGLIWQYLQIFLLL